jgi:hypothetical protein
MKLRLLTLTLAALPALAAPARAQTVDDQRRWEAAQSRFDAAIDDYQRERARYLASRSRGGGYYRQDDYGGPPPPGADPYATNYDAARYYRDDPRYQERRLSAQDEVYRGSDGRYYCKRNDGTTGLIVGGAAGGVLGNIIDGGHNRVAGTLIGGALGALAGRSIDQNSDIRCR